MEPLLTKSSSLRDAIGLIETNRRGIAVVVDEVGSLTGTITDGDIRRAILAGYDLDSNAIEICNRNPLTADIRTSENYLVELLTERALEAIPLIDARGRFVRIVHILDFRPEQALGGGEGFAAAVIMAGGEGKRLQPLTKNTPKPLIEVGGTPMIGRLVQSLARARVSTIYIAVNYLAHKIENYFRDGSEFGVNICYLREKEKMGTAGGLSLLPEFLNGSLLVINGDVLTGAEYSNLLSFHEEMGSMLTIAATKYRVDIPYGVLRADGARVINIEEKPSQQFLCNAGMYALSTKALNFLSGNGSQDMPDLIATLIEANCRVNVFPLHEYWLDVGNAADLEQARRDIKLLDEDDG